MEAHEISQTKIGFIHVVEHVRNGEVLSVEEVHNLMPTEGMNYFLNAALLGAAQTSAWYLGLFEGNYTPVVGVTAATFPSVATESTAYDEANRLAWTPGTPANGSVNNASNKATFTMNAMKSIYGLVQSSVPGKGAPTGVLVSVARFQNKKDVEAGDVLNVTSTISLTS